MNKSLKRLISLFVFIASLHSWLGGQGVYDNYEALSKKIRSLAAENPKLCSVKSVVRTAGGKEIWVLTIGTGDTDSKPGIAIFGGTEGEHILGRELALGFASSILKEYSTPEISDLLGKITFYVFPDVSPDASEQFFSDLKYERKGNARSTDDDRDFQFDEDGNEDLNHDGVITLIRVKDPAGRFIKSSEDERVMVEADISKGEKGNYQVYSEGVDNDKDGSFNEDGPGGVDFNRNFSFNYEFFGRQAGMYPVSEPETKAVADFLFDRFNIYSVFMFGPQDNLGLPMKPGSEPEKDGIVRSVIKEDGVINKLVSEKYHEITGVTGAPSVEPCRGDFMDWAYFHYGRYSFSTPAWWFSTDKEKSKEAAFLKYAAKWKQENIFVPWTAISHPDFPGKVTEVGGIKPFVMMNPPADSLDNLINRNYKFIIAIASMHPELELIDISKEDAGEDIWRISLRLHNKGIFATCAKTGDENQFTRIMRITAEPSKGQTIISGQKVQRVARLEGNQSAEFTWLISGKGTVKITAGAINTGIVTSSVELR